ncbi:MAG: hypothetical protein HON94_03795 [Methylococcales bacterium]|jgi:hypothetical protein|nr:hypothetical protein [Methylococcales bacterium]MBT7445632.1 hypothetical protein [Methylococcales bacterium]
MKLAEMKLPKTFDISLFEFTGEVIDHNKWATTRVSGSSQSVSSSTTVHDQIFIKNADGSEKSWSISGENMAIRVGHKISLIWMVKKSKERGSYVAYYNHTLNSLSYIFTQKHFHYQYFNGLIFAFSLIALYLVIAFTPAASGNWSHIHQAIFYYPLENYLAGLPKWVYILGFFPSAYILYCFKSYLTMFKRVKKFKKQFPAGLVKNLINSNFIVSQKTSDESDLHIRVTLSKVDIRDGKVIIKTPDSKKFEVKLPVPLKNGAIIKLKNAYQNNKDILVHISL